MGLREWRWSLPCVLAMPMLGCAQLLHQRAVIFPESAALATGVWTLGLPAWTASRRALLLLPPSCIVIGVALARARMPLPLAQALAMTAALIALQLWGSRLAPCLSAAMFPVVFDVRSWVCPLAVALECAAVVAGYALLRRGRTAAADVPRPRPVRWPGRVLLTSWTVGLGWIALADTLPGLSAAALSPPLFVAALEWSALSGPRRPEVMLRRWAVLVAAAGLGAVAVRLPLPVWVTGTAAVAATAALGMVLRQLHPPAMAVALIPAVFGDARPGVVPFTADVALAAAVLYLLSHLAARWTDRTRTRLPATGTAGEERQPVGS